MSLQLTSEIERRVQNLLSRGQFADENTVMAEAIRLLEEREQLRADIQLGLDQLERGASVPADIVFSDLRERAERIARGEA